MSSFPPDRALRRLVADLAAEQPQDVQAILAELEPAQRLRVEALLKSFLGQTVIRPTTGGAASTVPTPQDVSSGLLARLRGEEAFSITPFARDALRSLAAEMPTAPVAPRPRGLGAIFDAWRGGRQGGAA